MNKNFNRPQQGFWENKRLQVAYTHVQAQDCFMVYFKQDKKMSNMEKRYSYLSVIVPVNHVQLVTIECFINEGCNHKKVSNSSVCYLQPM